MKNPYPRTKLAALLAISCLAIAPAALAVDPPPDGDYPNSNTAEGSDALFTLTTGASNTAIGFRALYRNTTGGDNTANGASALYRNTTGGENTANGFEALFSNTTGASNTAIGFSALFANTIGNSNTAVGLSALANNTTGFANTATGYEALYNTTTSVGNTAIGNAALYLNTTGSSNTASGDSTLYSNTTGYANTANGAGALIANTTGAANTASGVNALQRNISGSSNTATGVNALLKNTGSFNIALGSNAGFNLTTGSNNIEIFDAGVPGESNTIRIGKIGTQQNTYIAGISGVTVASGVGVVIDTTGHLGTVVSSERFKDEIKPMNRASESIFSLQPVSFHYKHDLDPDGIPQFGLVAEQVEKVNPDLVARDEAGKPYTVRYEAVNAMLLNEFLKEHRKVEEQAALNQRQEATIARLEAALKAQAAQIQKVSNQVEASKPAPRLVADSQ